MRSRWEERFRVVARRFVAGTEPDDALDAAERLNAQGLRATLDFLGEDVNGREEAERTRNAYLALLRAMRARGVDANVSVKLSAIGLRVDEALAEENLGAIVGAATRTRDPFVRVDMEGSAVTAATLRVVEAVFARTGSVGPALQAYLKRTPGDVERAIALGMRVRLCKGAYREPPELAWRGPAQIRHAYLRAAEALLARGRYPGIATHDTRLVEAVQTFAREHGIGPERFEFQVLYGVNPGLQARLAGAGYNVRVYVPYGTHWARYFSRRITERPENALFALRALLRKP
jgi:proline dehydrogenase